MQKRVCVGGVDGGDMNQLKCWEREEKDEMEEEKEKKKDEGRRKEGMNKRKKGKVKKGKEQIKQRPLFQPLH